MAANDRPGVPLDAQVGPSEVLVDPFLDHRSVPPPRPPLSMAALASALLPVLLGPVGAIAAVPVGVAGRRQTRPGAMRGRWLANLGITLGVISTTAWLAGAGFVVHADAAGRKLEAHAAERDAARRTPEPEPTASAVPAPDRSSRVPPPAAAPIPPPRAAIPPNGTVPRITREEPVGEVVVVDVGVDETSLRAALERQQAIAKAQGKEVMVMTVSSSCIPCEGVYRSLPDPRMQEALAKVRVVRVDLEVFREELGRLGMQADRYPGYFLLRDDLTPRDAIDGGEWGEDIAENIAPVLGPFVRGRYKDRRHEWRGVFL